MTSLFVTSFVFMMSFLSELEQDPFDGDEFVERLAWRSTSGRYDHFDANLLHEAFESGIKDLKAILDNHQKKCERLEMICREEEKSHWIRVSQLQDRCKTSLSQFQQLDSRLELVSAKVVYLGDQLEGVNTPRARALEAYKLMRVFAAFLDQNEPPSDVTALCESADVIQKLSLIALELPNGPRFELARERIATKYDSIEKQLIEEFVSAHRADDRVGMRAMAKTLSHFKGYSQCVDAFIESAQYHNKDLQHVFQEVPALCARNKRLIEEVFPNWDSVLNKFVLNVFHGRLQELILNQLENCDDLNTLFDLYSKTNKMAQKLQQTIQTDPFFLTKITKNIFARKLQLYIQRETECLREKCQQILNRFYESRGHQKRPLVSGGLQELKRDLQLKMSRSTNQMEESLLSEEVAISVLQETKLALQRCSVLSRSQDLAANALQILEIQTQFLFFEHIDYAIELSLQSIVETKSQPDLSFADSVRQCNAICHLMEKQFNDCVLPLVANTGKHGECIKRKREINEQLENKLNSGLEKCLSLIVNWIRIVLQSEQKKTDFKPETEDIVVATQTQASAKVVRFMSQTIDKLRDCLDGKNVTEMLTELGIRAHRVIYEHFQCFQFSIVGAMVAICDVNEYRKCIQQFNIPLLNQLFAVLHALFNLLIVAPENLKHAMEEISLERTVVLNFVQLRADYKTQLKHQLR